MNRILLDTHTLIWLVSDETKLGDQARDVLFDSGLQKLISPASYWEMAIKIKQGHLTLNADYDDFFKQAVADYQLQILHVHLHHTSLLTTLDLYHKDPFDRLLIAQASVEDIPIISIDDKFDHYPVTRIWDYAEDEVTEGDTFAEVLLSNDQ